MLTAMLEVIIICKIAHIWWGWVIVAMALDWLWFASADYDTWE